MAKSKQGRHACVDFRKRVKKTFYMADKSDPDSKQETKFKIRPRAIDDESKEKKEEQKADEKDVAEGPKHKIWVGKNPFPGKAIESVSAGSAAEKKDGEPSITSDDELGVEFKPVQENEAQARVRKERKRKKEALVLAWQKKGAAFLKGIPALEVRLLPFLIGSLVVLMLFSWISRQRGLAEGREEGLKEANDAATKLKVELPADVANQLNGALFTLRKGDAAGALRTLRKLEEEREDYASMSYLVALAAMQNGDIPLAERKVQETIVKRERVSDALALQSVLETQKGADLTLATMGDPKVRSEALLRQSIIADAANPYPHFELATLLRYKGQREEAIEEIKAAQARLNPMDSHLVMDVTLSLINLELKPDSAAVASLESDDARKLLPSAYIAMTRGQFGLAAAILFKAKTLLAPDVFDYLVNDPAFRRYAREKELKKFYGN